jgi:fatty acid desaturase
MKCDRTKKLRMQLRKNLPASTFEPKPIYGYAAFLASALGVGIIVGCHLVSPPWYVLLIASIVIGQIWANASFAGHEALHGAIFKNKFLIDALTLIGFAHHFVGVEGWRTWHIRAHHSHTNKEGMDPDIVGLAKDYPHSRLTQFMNTFTIGSGRWWSILCLFAQFTVQGHLALWCHGPKWIEEKTIRYDINRARVETICLVAFWGMCAWWLGWYHAVWLLLLPLLMCNFTLMSYICTQHFLRPLTEFNDPLPNSLSVRTWKFFDIIHLHFSYHREHHLFPSMSHSMGPVLQKEMERLGFGVPAMTHWEAMKLVILTPRLYRDSHSLEMSGTGEKTNLIELWQKIDPNEAEIIDAVPRREFAETAPALQPPNPHFPVGKPGEIKQSSRK